MTATVNKDGVLAGKVAVVTGASRGIGEAIAIRYALEGAKVVVAARTLDDGDHVLAGGINSVVSRINDAGGDAKAIRADLGAKRRSGRKRWSTSRPSGTRTAPPARSRR